MKKLVHILMAFRQYLKQYHWLAKGYENHLLAERLDEEMSESLDDSIDRLTELALAVDIDDSIAKAEYSLIDAKRVLDNILSPDELESRETSVVLSNIAKFVHAYLTEAEATSKGYEGTVVKGGIDNAIFSISEDMIRRLYLLGIQTQEK